MNRTFLVFYVGLACGALHMFFYQLPIPSGVKASFGLILIGLGLFVVRKIP